MSYAGLSGHQRLDGTSAGAGGEVLPAEERVRRAGDERGAQQPGPGFRLEGGRHHHLAGTGAGGRRGRYTPHAHQGRYRQEAGHGSAAELHHEAGDDYNACGVSGIAPEQRVDSGGS